VPRATSAMVVVLVMLRPTLATFLVSVNAALSVSFATRPFSRLTPTLLSALNALPPLSPLPSLLWRLTTARIVGNATFPRTLLPMMAFAANALSAKSAKSLETRAIATFVSCTVVIVSLLVIAAFHCS
jgi:hypothetical protein